MPGAWCKPITCILFGITLDDLRGKKTLFVHFQLVSKWMFCLIFLPPCHIPLPSTLGQEILQRQLRCLMFVREAELALWADLHA